jgi:radial spoke head protein 9
VIVSSEDFKFAELPAQRHEFDARVKHMGEFFTGQHEKILIKGGGETAKTIKLDGEDFKVKSKNFTELDRLSTVVHQIDFECQVVPLGSFKMIPTHELILNPSFQGLKIGEANKLENYVHLRGPEHPEKKILIGTPSSIQNAIRLWNGKISWIL